MILKVFSVYDVKAEAYLQPFFFVTKGQAVRAFVDSLADVNHAFAQHPDDYTLFLLGEFNDENGEFVADHQSLGNGLEYIAKVEGPRRPEMSAEERFPRLADVKEQ